MDDRGPQTRAAEVEQVCLPQAPPLHHIGPAWSKSLRAGMHWHDVESLPVVLPVLLSGRRVTVVVSGMD